MSRKINFAFSATVIFLRLISNWSLDVVTVVCSPHYFLPSVEIVCYKFKNDKTLSTFMRVTATSPISGAVDGNSTQLYVDILDSVTKPTFHVDDSPSNLKYADILIGVAVDGVPIYAALSSSGADFVSQGLRTGSFAINQCGGSLSMTPDGMRYHYRVIPTCIWNSSNANERLTRNISSTFELLEYFDGFLTPKVLGYTITGYPIYSPCKFYNSISKDIDKCNGMYNGTHYGYYGTINFPYMKGCDQLGLYSQSSSKSILSSQENACPRGYYIDTQRSCTPCPAGRYSSLIRRQEIGLKYCNKIASQGYYSNAGSIYQTKCPAGRFGVSEGLQSEFCSGPCRSGHFCLPGSATATPFPCGNASYYCPEGSSNRISVSLGHFSAPGNVDENVRYTQLPCPSGSYCENGSQHYCPAGRYGNTSELSSSNCSGVCPIGSYCPVGSISPIPCPPGTYGNAEGLTDSSCSGLCPKGHYCPERSSSGTPCPGGRYGAREGLTHANCSALCSYIYDINQNIESFYCDRSECREGYYCPSGSSSGTEYPCGGPKYYCPSSSARPKLVDTGYYSSTSFHTQLTAQDSSDELIRSNQLPCESGHYCENGLKYKCPAGSYGDAFAIANRSCSGYCSAGYYCPEGSTSSRQYVCGNISVYCPIGSSNPIIVPDLYYSAGGTHSTRMNITKCPSGYYCSDGIKRPCPAGKYSVNGGNTSDCDGVCNAGYYCPEGSSSPMEYSCPSGRYGSVGMGDSYCSGTSPFDFVSFSSSYLINLGPCEKGYYCPSNSTSFRQYECGNNYVYCPDGSSYPIAVSLFHYSIGGNERTRTSQNACVFNETLGTPPQASHRRNICPDNTVLP